ncbi:hypothetical protein [Kineosporia babensis]|uniref:Uncharacterized protein n=1 Tax=Kineosporia babensis TaxID=499548 RepID=A0A9X1NNH4_9ACTN|nr:hypothetical protein [Kineosporia babensis]MCD5316981.1 hypothetical protein [Kineosporia babensis]
MSQKLSRQTADLKVLVIPADPRAPMQQVTIIGDPHRKLKDLVGGAVHCLELSQLPATLVVNERQLPPASGQRVNERAILLEWTSGKPDVPAVAHLTGAAVLLGPSVEGRYSSVHSEHLKMLLEDGNFRLQVKARKEHSRWDNLPFACPDWFTTAAAGIEANRMAQRKLTFRIVPEPSTELKKQWATLANPHLNQPLSAQDIVCHYEADELATAITEGPLTAGTAFAFFDLCLVNLADGDEKWLLIHDGVTHRLTPLRPLIALGALADVLEFLLNTQEPLTILLEDL